MVGYQGEWQNANFHGIGIYIAPDGTRYEGDWLNNEFQEIVNKTIDNPTITIELLSYEQKTNSYDDTPYCALSYSITNNSWGTLYKIRVKTEAFDDRDTKLDDYGLGGNILNPFSGWFDDQKFISVGDMKQVTNLEFGGQCKYMGTINALEVKPEDCNIRMMPEDGNCLDILDLKSKIDHIKFQM